MPAVTRSVDIAAPADRVMGVITDFQSYPSFLPAMRSVEILEAVEQTWHVRFRLSLIRALVYTLRLEQLSPLTLRWSLVDGAFRRNDGGWTLEDKGETTHATYALDLQVGIFIPTNILRSLIDKQLPATLEGFKRETERRHRA